MENEKNYKKIIIFLIIVVILLMLCILFITGNLNFSSNDRNNNSNENSNQNVIDNNNNNENDENNVDHSDYKLEAKTKIKIDLLWDDKFDNIEVINGDLMVNDRVFTIPNEKIKYFYLQRYQSSRSTVFHYLTESGNVYVNEFTSSKMMSSFNEFIKLDYSNVSEIVVLPNDHYGKTYDDVSGMIDNREYYLYAVINGEKMRLDYQYNY